MVEMEQAFWSHPSRYQVKYRAVSDGGDFEPLCTLVLESCPTYVTQDLSILTRFDGEVLSFEGTANGKVLVITER